MLEMDSKAKIYDRLVVALKKTKGPVDVGIDEAGRGPLAGPLVYALYVAAPGKITTYRDSKQLTPRQREMAFAAMDNYAYYMIDPVHITTMMNGGTMNLSQLSREAVKILLGELEKYCENVRTVYVDGLGNNETYRKELEAKFDMKFVVEYKADEKYQPVSAASIVAKVARDQAVVAFNCGSCYPSDPVTVAWLNSCDRSELDGFPQFVRHSWAPIKKFFSQKKARKLEIGDFYAGPE